MAYKVKAVAELAGVSVRALHHYDEIGLLKPAHSSSAGYRLYTDSDLERLQQILFFRELGFSLQEIKDILDRPGFNRKQALLSHRSLLVQKQKRLEEIIRSVDQTIQAMEKGTTMDKKEMFDPFDESKIEEYRREAREKYGKEAVAECEQRTAKYTKTDWHQIAAEGGAIAQRIADLMDRDPADPEVQEQIGKHHQMINNRFYTCTLEIFNGLADLYVEDARFTAFYERIRPGMAQFMHDAMKIYCRRAAGNSSK